MKIVDTMPPNGLYERIVATWMEVASNPYVVFAYGDTIYNPSGRTIPNYMIEHEKVHIRQQAEIGGPEIWWDHYLVNAKFRLDQELEAYRKEYKVFCFMYKDKNERNSFLRFQAIMLASPMYGNLMKINEAIERIKKA